MCCTQCVTCLIYKAALKCSTCTLPESALKFVSPQKRLARAMQYGYSTCHDTCCHALNAQVKDNMDSEGYLQTSFPPHNCPRKPCMGSTHSRLLSIPTLQALSAPRAASLLILRGPYLQLLHHCLLGGCGLRTADRASVRTAASLRLGCCARVSKASFAAVAEVTAAAMAGACSTQNCNVRSISRPGVSSGISIVR